MSVTKEAAALDFNQPLTAPAYVLYNAKAARQLDRVYSVLIDTTRPKTLQEISALTGIRSEVSIGGRIRELRQLGYDVERGLHPTANRGSRIFTYLLK